MRDGEGELVEEGEESFFPSFLMLGRAAAAAAAAAANVLHKEMKCEPPFLLPPFFPRRHKSTLPLLGMFEQLKGSWGGRDKEGRRGDKYFLCTCTACNDRIVSLRCTEGSWHLCH